MAIRLNMPQSLTAVSAPTVLRLRKTEQFLQGRAFTEDTMAEAGDQAIREITPISDVRGR